MMDNHLSTPDPSSANSQDEIGSEDDLFTTYIDLDKLNGSHANINNADTNENAIIGQISRVGRRKHSNSVDRCSFFNNNSANACSSNSTTTSSSSACTAKEIIDAKKAMPPDQLAELWNIDPRRARRIIPKRQSASRSKERKARYIRELEFNVQTFRNEATTLSAQLSLFQRDTICLTTENTELELRLQAMDQQSQLRDALNESLKKEFERLKIATGEMALTHVHRTNHQASFQCHSNLYLLVLMTCSCYHLALSHLICISSHHPLFLFRNICKTILLADFKSLKSEAIESSNTLTKTSS